ncbi:rhomboid family intramembrane serine protease [Alloalcanivorax gelatiniphagus]|uniref:Rhomboid family intramembrane serine protease n=1 Tax=Alloalcanivorax gelatiniphagus TaxID=1194167 RepID=A0ABY2XFL3_9GAMM|nr:rhomboid family intramembrane serine protease [Alloalcanivorax gelatiniphagus]TMW10382.1 rhomboid family intramembrane serine protease [Alloalcanivorax gelatiniphagus]|tara:strand:- start:17886 stop:18728 length:843 start_codon:yes stop_codon:yes gene_type:complete
MLELVRINNAAMAKRLADLLARRGIETRLDQEQGGQYRLFLADPARHDEARELAREFLAEPNAGKWQEDAWRASEPVTGLPREKVFLGGGWFASLGPVTRTGLIACVLIFLSPYVIGPVVYQALMFPDQPQTLMAQPWRLLTPMLLHFSVLHIIFNLLWWCDLGRLIERFQSSFQLLWLTLVVAAVSNYAQYLDTGPRFGGLSGVVYGLLGYLWLYGKVNPAAGYQLRREIVLLMLVWLVICYVGLSGIVANTAHLTGLLSGAVIGVLVGLYRRMGYHRG